MQKMVIKLKYIILNINTDVEHVKRSYTNENNHIYYQVRNNLSFWY